VNANHLLFWMSARRQGSWPQFRGAVEELHFSPMENAAGEEAVGEKASGLPIYWDLRYNFHRLGHAEFADHKWRISPPVLAVSKISERWTGVLCGARLPALIEKIKTTETGCTVTETPQNAAPDLITVSSNSFDLLVEVGKSAGLRVQTDATRALLAFLPPIDDARCQTPCEMPAGDGWEVKRFSVSSLAWRDSNRNDAAAASFGVFRFEYQNQKQYLLCRRGDASRVNVQVGKFLALKSRHRRRGILQYDCANKSLAMPLMCHPPPVLFRALALCSGMLPRNDAGTLRFGSVAEDVALYAAHLLRQEIR
jgi:hypothetical protein